MSGSLPNVIETIKLNTIEEAIADIRAGKVVIVVDDEDRENEGDFICAAECITPEIINFMATHGRGLICTPIQESRAEELELQMMVPQNTDLHETAFTVSIDLIGQGCTTGISAYDRSQGIKALINPNTRPTDFARPGHIFPLRAKAGGVLRRTGHTEAAIDLAQLAGYYPAGVVVEILNEDGTMARLPQLVKIAELHQLKIIAIKDLVAYRMRTERLIRKEFSVELDTPYGNFEVIAYTQLTTDDVHLVFKKGEWTGKEPVLVRVHSASYSDDFLGNILGDNNIHFQKTLNYLEEQGEGILLYMRHSDKAANILDKLKSYKSDQENSNSAETGKMDQRDFGIGAQILRDLNISKIKLITNNPKKRVGLIGYGLEIVDNIEL